MRPRPMTGSTATRSRFGPRLPRALAGSPVTPSVKIDVALAPVIRPNNQRLAVWAEYGKVEMRGKVRLARKILRSPKKPCETRYGDVVALALQSGVIVVENEPIPTTALGHRYLSIYMARCRCLESATGFLSLYVALTQALEYLN